MGNAIAPPGQAGGSVRFRFVIGAAAPRIIIKSTMAYLVCGDGPNAPKFYNVEQAVGANAPNGSGDVKLVQYLLRHYYGNAAAQLAVDGWIGSVTISWIRRFQEDAKKAGANVLVDSRIDRAFGQVSSVSKTTYTILLLNAALRSKNPAAFQALPQSVPMSAKPKANPYNKKVKTVFKFTQSPPYTLVVVYDDGSEATMVVQGQLQFPPGTEVVYIPNAFGI